MKRSDGIVFLAGFFATLTFAYENLSFKKNATQSKTYPGSQNMFNAENAVDNNIATCMRTDPIGQNSPEKKVWWKVDLGGVYDINTVNILFKNYNGQEERQRGRFAGFSLYVSNSGEKEESSICYKDGPQLPPLNFTTTCNTSGRYVIFYNERLNKDDYPKNYEVANVYTELCEVFVYGFEKSKFITTTTTTTTTPPTTTTTPPPTTTITPTTNSLGVLRSESKSILWTYVTPVSLGINMLLLCGVFFCLWGVFTNRVFVFCKRQSRGKSCIIAETKSTPEECSNYRELDVSGGLMLYENTILN